MANRLRARALVACLRRAEPARVWSAGRVTDRRERPLYGTCGHIRRRSLPVKPITYHYVRPAVPGLTHFPFLKLADFERQLDHFANTYGFVSRKAFEGWLAGGAAPR